MKPDPKAAESVRVMPKMLAGHRHSRAVPPSMSDQLVQNVRIRRGIEGPQLIVEWDAPPVIVFLSTIRVVRQLYEFSTSPFVGVVVYDGPNGAGFVDDLDLDPCKCYYYTIFVRTPDNQYLFSVDTQVAEMALASGYFTHKLFELLPNTYILGDKILEKADKSGDLIALSPTFDPVSKETFNIYENTDPTVAPKTKGPLNRFLKTIASELDIVKGLIDCMPTLWDVDEACCSILPYLGALIGLEVNQELPCSAQREEIKNQVAIYKIKGTIAGITALARSVSGLNAGVQECHLNILISNRLDRTSLRFPNPNLGQVYGLLGDDTSYTPGNGRDFLCFMIFFQLECDDCVSEQKVAKLNRVLPESYPACHNGELVFQDCYFKDTYDRNRLVEKFYEIDEDNELANREDALELCWLISNRLPDPPDLPGPSLTDPLFRNLSNSLHAVTANPFRVCMERYYDIIETCCQRVNFGRVNCSRVNVSGPTDCTGL